MNIRYTYTDGQVALPFAQDNGSDYFEIGGKVVRIVKVCELKVKPPKLKLVTVNGRNVND